MYCANCGNKQENSAKFCMKCGTKIAEIDKDKKQARLYPNLNLLKGLESWIESEIRKDGDTAYLLALKALVDEYPHRYKADGLLLTTMIPDVQEFIFNQKFIVLINTELNALELNKLSEDERQEFEKELVAFNKFRVDIIIIGYMFRGFSGYLNSNTIFDEFNVEDTPYQAIKKLLKLNELRLPGQDSGFGFPMGATNVLGLSNKGLMSFIEENIKTSSKFSQVFIFPDKHNVFLLLLLGWCLGRFDLARKS